MVVLSFMIQLVQLTESVPRFASRRSMSRAVDGSRAASFYASSELTEAWYEQPVDHFNFGSTLGTWKQRYLTGEDSN